MDYPFFYILILKKAKQIKTKQYNTIQHNTIQYKQYKTKQNNTKQYNTRHNVKIRERDLSVEITTIYQLTKLEHV